MQKQVQSRAAASRSKQHIQRKTGRDQAFSGNCDFSGSVIYKVQQAAQGKPQVAQSVSPFCFLFRALFTKCFGERGEHGVATQKL